MVSREILYALFFFYILMGTNYNINTFNSLGTVNIKVMVRIKLFINQKNINLYCLCPFNIMNSKQTFSLPNPKRKLIFLGHRINI